MTWKKVWNGLDERRRRLFAIACCRHIWHVLVDGRSQAIVRLCERGATGDELAKGVEGAREASLAQKACVTNWGPWMGAEAALHLGRGQFRNCVGLAKSSLSIRECVPVDGAMFVTKLVRQFVAPVKCKRSWVTANVRTVAEGAYGALTDGSIELPSRLVLADALMDEGCDNKALLGHLTRPGPYYRGYWSLDTVLGYTGLVV